MEKFNSSVNFTAHDVQLYGNRTDSKQFLLKAAHQVEDMLARCTPNMDRTVLLVANMPDRSITLQLSLARQKEMQQQ